MIHIVASPDESHGHLLDMPAACARHDRRGRNGESLRTFRVDTYLATMNPAVSQLKAFITRLDRQRGSH
jgi:hypothetical protein